MVIETAGYHKYHELSTHTIQPSHAEPTDQAEVIKLIPEHYHLHWKVFSEALYHFPPTREEDHAIILKPGAPSTIDCQVYCQTETELEGTCQFITDTLAKGYITNSKLPYVSGLFYWAKKDGELHHIMDYHMLNHMLNKWMICNTYPLPLIGNILDHLQGKTLFTKFDIHWGYNNICIKEEDRWKAAF